MSYEVDSANVKFALKLAAHLNHSNLKHCFFAFVFKCENKFIFNKVLMCTSNIILQSLDYLTKQKIFQSQ